MKNNKLIAKINYFYKKASDAEESLIKKDVSDFIDALYSLGDNITSSIKDVPSYLKTMLNYTLDLKTLQLILDKIMLVSRNFAEIKASAEKNNVLKTMDVAYKKVYGKIEELKYTKAPETSADNTVQTMKEVKIEGDVPKKVSYQPIPKITQHQLNAILKLDRPLKEDGLLGPETKKALDLFIKKYPEKRPVPADVEAVWYDVVKKRNPGLVGWPEF